MTLTIHPHRRNHGDPSTGCLGHSHERARETADVDVAVAATSWPTGSRAIRTAGSTSPPAAHSIAIRPRTSVSESNSYRGTFSSPDPSNARTRSRRAFTRVRRASPTVPLYAATADTFAAINALITRGPSPTANAQQPLAQSSAISSYRRTPPYGHGERARVGPLRLVPLVTVVPFLVVLLTERPRPLGTSQVGHLPRGDERTDAELRRAGSSRPGAVTSRCTRKRACSGPTKPGAFSRDWLVVVDPVATK